MDIHQSPRETAPKFTLVARALSSVPGFIFFTETIFRDANSTLYFLSIIDFAITGPVMIEMQ
jgi:hypothetical protein